MHLLIINAIIFPTTTILQDAAKSLMVELRGVADCKDAPDGMEPCNSDYDVALLGSLPLPGSLPGGLYHLAASYEVLLQHEGLVSMGYMLSVLAVVSGQVLRNKVLGYVNGFNRCN
jgi:hypothetical protein